MSSQPPPTIPASAPGHGTRFIAVMVTMVWLGVAFSARDTALVVPALMAAAASIALTLWLVHEGQRLGRELAAARATAQTRAAHAALVDVALADDITVMLARSAALLGASRACLQVDAAGETALYAWAASGVEVDAGAAWWQDVCGEDDIWISDDQTPARCAALIRQDQARLGVLCFEAAGRHRPFGAEEAGMLWALATLARQQLLRLRLQQALARAGDDHASERRQFLSRLSHKLRTPMTAVLGFAQILDLDEGLNEQQREFVREIEAAGQALLAMLNELVGIGRE